VKKKEEKKKKEFPWVGKRTQGLNLNTPHRCVKRCPFPIMEGRKEKGIWIVSYDAYLQVHGGAERRGEKKKGEWNASESSFEVLLLRASSGGEKTGERIFLFFYQRGGGKRRRSVTANCFHSEEKEKKKEKNVTVHYICGPHCLT